MPWLLLADRSSVAAIQREKEREKQSVDVEADGGPD
jgi:hypothetical protein